MEAALRNHVRVIDDWGLKQLTRTSPGVPRGARTRGRRNAGISAHRGACPVESRAIVVWVPSAVSFRTTPWTYEHVLVALISVAEGDGVR